jgi:UDP:flavonoid glycosyltransferase YjiC (YdhE family)
MATVLCAWELGAGLGHLTRLLPVARSLHDLGHDIILAILNRGAAKTVLEQTFPGFVTGNSAGYRLRVRQCPRWRADGLPEDGKLPASHSFADLLHLQGYHQTDRLGETSKFWLQLLRETKPDLILADWAPTLRLVNREITPFVMVGNGYSIPPGGCVLPPIRPWRSTVPPLTRAKEADVLRAVNILRNRLRGPTIDHVSDLLNGDRSYICTIPEFDPYERFRSEPTLAPFNVPDIRQFSHVSDRPKRRTLVYLPASNPQTETVLRAISRLGIPCDAYISGKGDTEVVKEAKSNIRISREPFDFEKVLSGYRLIIHHAGLGTAFAALTAGTPQLLFPARLEHAITAAGAERFGAAISDPASRASSLETVMGEIEQLLTDEAVWDSAFQTAQRLSRRPRLTTPEIILAGCLEFLKNGHRNMEDLPAAESTTTGR